MMVDRQYDSSVTGPDAGSVAGTWSPQWSTWEEILTPTEELCDVALTFADGRCEVRRGERLIRRGTYATDPTRSPKTIDVCFTESDVPELVGAPLRGIYEVSAEQLRICYGPPDGDRARSFSAEKGTRQYLAEYRRSDGKG
ncbi:MAG: hypothetical protein HY238_19795 [Acidobacteria bacterium]|nr:hypothetical protein [Acidobacteriota bacterium]